MNWKTGINDIYGSEEKYGKLLETMDEYLLQPKFPRKYQIKNPKNLVHIKKVLNSLDARGLSYLRRLTCFYHLLILGHYTTKEFPKLSRDDVDDIMRIVRSTLKPGNQHRFIKNLKFTSKIFAPEVDEKGRVDEQTIPYAFRHLSTKLERSKQKSRIMMSPEEVHSIIQFFRQDSRLQAFLSLMYESLARPQELLYLKIQDVESFDNYAKVHVREHGKEGTKWLECIDSYPYLLKWYNEHPFRNNPTAWLFCNTGRRGRHEQMSTFNLNKHLRKAVLKLGIKHKVVLYDFKRAGVTHSRIRGDSDVEIQHRAGWTSSKQIQTYDHSKHDESFKKQLIKRGYIAPDQVPEHLKSLLPESRKCSFCEAQNGLIEKICVNCKRPLDRKAILDAEVKLKATMEGMAGQLSTITKAMEQMKKVESEKDKLFKELLDDNMVRTQKKIEQLSKRLHEKK